MVVLRRFSWIQQGSCAASRQPRIESGSKELDGPRGGEEGEGDYKEFIQVDLETQALGLKT